MHFGKIVLLVLGAIVLTLATATAIFWSMTSILALPYGLAISLLGAVGTWVAGLGAFGAAGIALWLARRTEKVRMKCIVDLYGMYYGDARPRECCVLFEVTNLGMLPIIVDAIEWCIGTGRDKKCSKHIFFKADSFALPKRLEYGESADFRDSWKEEETKIWMRNLAEMVGITRSNIKTLRARIHTTIGHVEAVKLSKDFMEVLAEAINSNPTAGTE